MLVCMAQECMLLPAVAQETGILDGTFNRTCSILFNLLTESRTHMINFVRLNGKSYLVDVAFGGLGPSKPLLLESNLISAGVGKQELRLSQDLVKTQRESERLWIFEQRKRYDISLFMH